MRQSARVVELWKKFWDKHVWVWSKQVQGQCRNTNCRVQRNEWLAEDFSSSESSMESEDCDQGSQRWKAQLQYIISFPSERAVCPVLSPCTNRAWVICNGQILRWKNYRDQTFMSSPPPAEEPVWKNINIFPSLPGQCSSAGSQWQCLSIYTDSLEKSRFCTFSQDAFGIVYNLHMWPVLCPGIQEWVPCMIYNFVYTSFLHYEKSSLKKKILNS